MTRSERVSAECGDDRNQSKSLFRALEAVASVEQRFTDRFYTLLFLRRPDTRALFGAHPISEQEEMMRETLRSLLALEDLTSAPPSELIVNLEALGKSHAEYGVTSDMYEDYRTVMVECAAELLGQALDTDARLALDQGIKRICETMLPQDGPPRSHLSDRCCSPKGAHAKRREFDLP